MKKRILRILILIAIFFASNQVFAQVMNSESTESASDLDDPALPVMYVNLDGQTVNRMHGYTMEMDGRKIRDGIIPLTTDRTISVSYRAYGNSIDSVSYEVITPDTGERIENAKIGGFAENGGMYTATFSLTQPILMDREYPIRFTIQSGDREYYYYARLLQRADLTIRQYIEFVNSFYQTCINKQAAMEVNAYIEPDETITNNSYAAVNIHSTLEQITWGELSPQLVRKAVPCIKEINSTTCSMTCEYLISSVNTRGYTEIYHVSEFYRMRYYNNRVMLLDFERQALQEYAGLGGQITATGVNLGVSTRNVHYSSNEAGTIVSFVQDGALWEFNENTQKLALIFNFHSEEDGTDERFDFTDYGIRILRTAENGDLDFVVYGYMMRGLHEGASGVSVCHYSAERVSVEEKLFVPYQGSSEVLANDVNGLAYLTEDGKFYLYMNDCLYRFDTESGASALLLSAIHPDCFAAGTSGRYAAWCEEMDPDAGKTIVMMDFETGKTRTIKGDTGIFIRVIGFINDDLIYGMAAEEDLKPSLSGSLVFAMKQLTITSFDDSEHKDYSENGLWISDVTIEEGLISLTRVSRIGNTYKEAASDDIMNNKQTGNKNVSVNVSNTSRQGTVIALKMAGSNTNLSPLISAAKIRSPKRDVLAGVQAVPSDVARYYVYTRGSLTAVRTDPGPCVTLADQGAGVVLDEQNRYIWERANKESRMELYNEDVPEIMLEGRLDINALQEACPNVRMLDLSGCTLDEVLYRISEGCVVIARKADGTSAVIVGYDPYNTKLLNEETGEHYYYGINDSTALFEEGGNVFISYIEDRDTMKR